MVFLILLLVPLLVMAGAYLLWREVTWQEALAQTGAQAVVAGISALIVYHSSVGDTEVWNGRVTGKEKVWTSCSHSYQCNCRETCSGSGTSRTCSTTCDTCYDHSNDYNWEVYTTNKETIQIDRIDRQGSDMPPRWNAVKIGEPTAVEHTYTNYIKGSPDTLFRRQGQDTEKFKGRLPTYPKVRDYYVMDRFLSSVSGQDAAAWNAGLAKLNADLGAAKQVNMLVILTNEPAEFFYALEEAWLGGKKNDVVLVIGVGADSKPSWANVMAWTDANIFKVQLRDDVLALPKIGHETVLPVLGKNVEATYVRKPMKDFEYLKASISPTTTQWVVSLIFGFVFSGGLTYLLHVYRQRKRHGFNRPYVGRSSFGRVRYH